MVLSCNVRIHFVFAYYFISPLRLVPGFSGIAPMIIVAVKCLIMKRKFKHIWTMKTNVSGVNVKFQVKTPLQSMHIFLPLLRLSFLSPMEAGIKTWIQPLPDSSNKNKIGFGGVMTTRLGQWMLYSSKMAKYDNVLVVFCSSVILCSGKRQNIDNLDCKR
jgi:hypothetical protein